MSLTVCATTIGLTERLKTALAAFGTDEHAAAAGYARPVSHLRAGSSPRASRMSTSCRPDLRAVSANLASCHSSRR